jgi:hypothetical protein
MLANNLTPNKHKQAGIKKTKKEQIVTATWGVLLVK